ncbi:hypothetical protein LTR37_001603 [Vermiconidia calcicola]|uniref:Uncharacterized protein n=1 Tax=Vermiconidia calcicola TaxID=1690605 RepID=A0ACC3NWY6_9PEZI|nr:hypothetical protein LTR37_001603 [Vermiconidia calcicola]
MKLLSLIAALAFATTTLAGDPMANDWKNAGECAQHSPDINAAIDDFCNKGDIMVPSKYARNGKTSGSAHVSIKGSCSPKQWVPKTYCQAQFHAVCANGGPLGGGKKKFNGCQKFVINRVHHN